MNAEESCGVLSSSTNSVEAGTSAIGMKCLLKSLDNQYSWAMPETPELPSTQVRRMWYDTVGHFHVPALRCACQSFGTDRLVLGTDFPYLTGDWYRRSVRYVEEAGLGAEDVDAILEDNATQLFELK